MTMNYSILKGTRRTKHKKIYTKDKKVLNNFFIIFFSLHLNPLVRVGPTHQNMEHQPQANQDVFNLRFHLVSQ